MIKTQLFNDNSFDYEIICFKFPVLCLCLVLCRFNGNVHLCFICVLKGFWFVWLQHITGFVLFHKLLFKSILALFPSDFPEILSYLIFELGQINWDIEKIFLANTDGMPDMHWDNFLLINVTNKLIAFHVTDSHLEVCLYLSSSYKATYDN